MPLRNAARPPTSIAPTSTAATSTAPTSIAAGPKRPAPIDPAAIDQGPIRPAPVARVLVGAALAGVLVAGCSVAVGGTPAMDVTSAVAAPVSSGPASALTGTGPALPNTLSFHLPAPPTPTITGFGTTPVAPTTMSEGTPTRDATSVTGTGATVSAADLDKILAQLAVDPLVADADATKAAGATALAGLSRQITDARAAGLPVTVVLIGHEVDDLSELTDTIAQRTRGTSIAVSTTHFAVSSKDFTAAQLTQAEQAATRAGGPVDAAASLIASLLAQRAASTGTPTSSG